MRKADTFPGLILGAGAAEQVEDTFVVLLANASAVILNFD